MNKLILVIVLVFSINAQATDFSDVGPEILFYDNCNVDLFSNDTTSIEVVNHNKGNREYLHEDIVPAALLY